MRASLTFKYALRDTVNEASENPERKRAKNRARKLLAVAATNDHTPNMAKPRSCECFGPNWEVRKPTGMSAASLPEQQMSHDPHPPRTLPKDRAAAHMPTNESSRPRDRGYRVAFARATPMHIIDQHC